MDMLRTASRRRLATDALIIVGSITIAAILWRTGLLNRFTEALDGYGWIGIFVAGALFTSVFTTAPAIATLAQLSYDHSLTSMIVLGAAGATLGDLVLFHFMRERVAENLQDVFDEHSGPLRRFKKIIDTRLFRFFAPSIGAAVIASPLPDELGIALLGLSRVKMVTFIPLAFLFNAIGISAIAFVAQVVAQ